MIILLSGLLITLLMLTTSKKPYNPNYDASTAEDINWNTTDLLSFLDNIHNVPLNDITTTGKDIQFYQTATKAETAAELIRTINFTHYKLLSAVKAVIDYNNILLNKTKTLNNSFDLCEKKLIKLAAQTQRNNVLLLQMKMAHLRPKPPIKDLKNDICQSIPIDPNVNESTYQIINGSPTNPPVILREPQLNTNISDTINDDKTLNISPPIIITSEQITQIISANPRKKNIKKNEPQLNYNTIKLSIGAKNESPTKMYSTQDSITISSPIKPIVAHTTIDTDESSQRHCSDDNSQVIKQIKAKNKNKKKNLLINDGSLEQNNPSIIIQKSIDYNKCGQTSILNKPQIELEITQSNCTSTNSCAVTRDTKKIITKTHLKSKKKKYKPKIKLSKKKKKINNKNNNKRNNKNKLKHQKNLKKNTTAKIVISASGLENIVRNYFTDDDYQDWLNVCLFNPQYTAVMHYEKTYGASAIKQIIQSHKNDQ